MTVDIVFADTEVGQDGHIDLFLHAYEQRPAEHADDIAQAFLDWLQSDRGHARRWTITSSRQQITTSRSQQPPA